jgi:hypothetical protein
VKGSKFASIYAVAVAVLMIGMWISFIVSGQVPEFQRKAAEILLHIADELFTALLLVLSGILVLRRVQWANITLLIHPKRGCCLRGDVCPAPGSGPVCCGCSD